MFVLYLILDCITKEIILDINYFKSFYAFYKLDQLTLAEPHYFANFKQKTDCTSL